MSVKRIIVEMYMTGDLLCEEFSDDLAATPWLDSLEGSYAIGLNLFILFIFIPFCLGVTLNNLFFVECHNLPGMFMMVFFSMFSIVPSAIVKKTWRKRREKLDRMLIAALEEI